MNRGWFGFKTDDLELCRFMILGVFGLRDSSRHGFGYFLICFLGDVLPNSICFFYIILDGS